MTIDPGLDRHEWETEFSQLEPDLHDAPIEALPDFADLVERMLLARGYALEPESRDETGPVPEFLAARTVATRGDQADPGDVADAVEKLQSLYDFLSDEGRAP